MSLAEETDEKSHVVSPNIYQNIYVYCQNAIACSWTMIENLGLESVIGKMLQFFRWKSQDQHICLFPPRKNL